MKGIRVRVLTRPFILWLGVREPLIKMNGHGWLGQIRQPIKHQIGSFRPIMDKMHKHLILCIIVARSPLKYPNTRPEVRENFVA